MTQLEEKHFLKEKFVNPNAVCQISNVPAPLIPLQQHFQTLDSIQSSPSAGPALALSAFSARIILTILNDLNAVAQF
jgi:hypothetical protein